MTPLGTLIRYFREDRGLNQQELADQSGVDSKLISSFETGRRRTPNSEVLEKIKATLKLTELESLQLQEAANNSSYIIRFPREMPPRKLRLLHTLVRSLSDLAPEQLSAIQHEINGRRSQER